MTSVERERTGVVGMPHDGPPLDVLSLDRLRADRTAARRDLELGQMRARQHDGIADSALSGLRERVSALTEELIARYAADLSLVDSLLDGSYPAEGTSTYARHAEQPEVGS